MVDDSLSHCKAPLYALDNPSTTSGRPVFLVVTATFYLGSSPAAALGVPPESAGASRPR